jgi:hypothetical protein
MYEPEFAGPIEGYVHNFLKTNFWKVSRSMEYEDCIQEARLVFLECKSRYPVVDNPKWFMSLFKRAWFTHFVDLASSDTKAKAEVTEFDETPVLESVVGDDHPGMVLMMIEKAPQEIKSVMALLINAPTELIETLVTDLSGGPIMRRRALRKINACIGLEDTRDVVQEMQVYFQS